MILASLLWVVGTASADDLVVSVPSSMDRVVLQCAEQRYEQVVPRSAGPTSQVRFPIRPGRECQVTFEQEAGTLSQLGTWNCDERGCTEVRQDIGEVEVLPPGTIKIITSIDLPHRTLELTCSGGVRVRTPVSDHIGLFTGIPDEDCELFFKGGAPYHFRPIRWGTWACTVTAATLVCEQRG